jgi:hypothetical protein
MYFIQHCFICCPSDCGGGCWDQIQDCCDFCHWHLTDSLLIEVVLLLIGLTQISFCQKLVFDSLGRDQSSFRLSALKYKHNQSCTAV